MTHETHHIESRIFPANLLHASWQSFHAEGFSKPVTGVIYRGEPKPTCGMPLGGIDTGCIDIEPNGMLGYSTIFNHLINPRLLINLPFMGMNCDGKTTVLVSDLNCKIHTPTTSVTNIEFPNTDYTPRYRKLQLDGVDIIPSIDYWGHYPIVDMEYNQPESPIQIGVRAWSPFIPGDEVASMLPGAVFDVTLRNRTKELKRGTFAFSFPGFDVRDEGSKRLITRTLIINEKVHGLVVESGRKGDAWEMSYGLMVGQGENCRLGGSLDAFGPKWAFISESLPDPEDGSTGSSLAVDFTLEPGLIKKMRIIFTWNAPFWRAGGSPKVENTDLHKHLYAHYYRDVVSTATKLEELADTYLRKIICWQEIIYSDENTPGWLADALINILHLIPETSIWGQALPPIGDWCKPEDGLFALNECPRGCPQFECLPCSFYGNIPIYYFFPRAALSTLRGYKAYQYEDGRPAWIFGGVTAREPDNAPPYGISRPDIGYQSILNGACYIIMADRYWQMTGDKVFLLEFYNSLKRANEFAMNLRPEYGDSQIVSMPTPGTDSGGLGDTEWFEAPEPGWKGYVTHAGAIRMAQVQIMRRMAIEMGDIEYIEKCDRWLASGSDILEKILWQGKYYLNFYEKETDTRSELVFGYQLDGQWIADWHGTDGVMPEAHTRITLGTIRQINCSISQSGAVNYANLDGTPAKVGGYGPFSYFPPEAFMLAFTFMYHGQREFGIDLLKRILENIIRWGYVGDFPNTVRGDKDTGQRSFGADYYQNMMLWAAPSAFVRGNIQSITQGNGLVGKILKSLRNM